MRYWNPVNALEIVGPGEWVFFSRRGTARLGVIRLLEFGAGYDRERWFRAVTWAEASADRQLLGYTRSLAGAAHLVWAHYEPEDAEGLRPRQSVPRT